MSFEFQVPKKEEVSITNQAIFDKLEQGLGFVPNLYATYAHSETALQDYLALQNRKSSLKAKEREVINLVVSQVNECEYCLAAHTALGKMNGFTDEQILEIRTGSVSFDQKLNALANFTKEATINRSKPSLAAIQQFLEAGYTQEQLVDTIIIIGDKMISNFIHGTFKSPIDFPLAPALEVATV